MKDVGDGVTNVATQQIHTSWQQNIKTIWFCFLVSSATLQYGLDVSIINAAQALKGFLMVFGHENPDAPQGYGIAPEFQQSITSLMNIGLVVGSFTLEFFTDKFGRRKNFIVSSFAALGANVILILSTSKAAIVFGRFLFGVSNGWYIGFVSIYISEAAPSHLRGSLVSFVQLSVCLGTVVGSVVNNYTKHIETRMAYQIPLFCLFPIPVFWLVNAWLIPESPRWLILKGRVDEARRHLARLRGSKIPAELIDAEIAAIVQSVESEKDTKLKGWRAIRLMFSPAELRRTLLTVASGCMNAASGFPFISGYKTYFFQIAKSQNPFIDSIIVTTVSLFGAVVGLFLHRYVGRRPVLMFGFGVQAILMMVIAAVWTAAPGTVSTGKVIVAMVVMFQCLYSAIVGPGSWIVSSEIPNNRLRATTFGFGNGVGFIAYFLISFTTPYFINPEALNVGPKGLSSSLLTFAYAIIANLWTSRVHLARFERHHRSLHLLLHSRKTQRGPE